MRITSENLDIAFDKIREKSTWNSQTHNELKMHKIHAYPAKFPAFLITKSLEYAEKNNINVETLGDIFCGCGTTALEAKKYNKQFWGCDINPVATLIAKVKRTKYDVLQLNEYYTSISAMYNDDSYCPINIFIDHDRINYWFHVSQINDLNKLLNAVREVTPVGDYRDFFSVAFSNILKKTSKWLTKSIKPQIDPIKPVFPISKAFKYQYNLMVKAVAEVNNSITVEPAVEIVNKNFLEIDDSTTFLDMLICSPPYVTSYEYADLHQLSTMWLGYIYDFRELREGTIGSLYHHNFNMEDERVDSNVRELYHRLVKAKASSPKSVIKYFIDMENTINRTFSIVNPGGLAVFVIGNTTYKDVYIDNAKFITNKMLKVGFSEIEVFKRKISGKILSPYRDSNGKFSKNKNDRKVYSYEYVLIAKKI